VARAALKGERSTEELVRLIVEKDGLHQLTVSAAVRRWRVGPMTMSELVRVIDYIYEDSHRL
jgi:hypothetical protein